MSFFGSSGSPRNTRPFFTASPRGVGRPAKHVPSARVGSSRLLFQRNRRPSFLLSRGNNGAAERNAIRGGTDKRIIWLGSSPRDGGVDSDVLGFFKRQGTGYQTRMNQVLRRYMDIAGQLRARSADPTRRQASRRQKPTSKRAR